MGSAACYGRAVNASSALAPAGAPTEELSATSSTSTTTGATVNVSSPTTSQGGSATARAQARRASSGGGARAAASEAGAAPAAVPALQCCVPGCGLDLSDATAYLKRYRLCLPHQRVGIPRTRHPPQCAQLPPAMDACSWEPQ
jgi:hypothetical protein